MFLPFPASSPSLFAFVWLSSSTIVFWTFESILERGKVCLYLLLLSDHPSDHHFVFWRRFFNFCNRSLILVSFWSSFIPYDSRAFFDLYLISCIHLCISWFWNLVHHCFSSVYLWVGSSLTRFSWWSGLELPCRISVLGFYPPDPSIAEIDLR